MMAERSTEEKYMTGVFIDGSNLFWAEKDNWPLDYNAFKDYLEGQHSPQFYHYYGCRDEDPKTKEYKRKAKKQNQFYKQLKGYGYKLIIKPLKYIKTDKKDSEGNCVRKTKCDMDVEICIDVKNYLEDLNTIILVSGDSDFLKLVKDCHREGKTVEIYSYKNFLAWELRNFAVNHPKCNFHLLDELKSKLKYN